MPPRYFLRCLGSPELRGPTGEPIRIRTRKHLALLIYLAVEPRQHHRRDRLADLLWPKSSLAEARHSLATALSMIRGKLGPRSYESTRDTVKLVVPDLEVDLDRLVRGEVLGDEYTSPLEMGGFLDDFEIPTSPEFMHWRDQRRSQLFPTIRNGFVALMDRRRRTGAFAEIEPLADRLLELDPLSEEGIRAKMEGRAFAGDRISALRIFQSWKEKLQNDLGALPSPLVEGMALRLRHRGLESPGASHVPRVQTDQWRDRAFVGRAAEYRSLYERWELTRNGQGHHAIVLGESGIGKTTVLERLVTAIGLEGAVFSRVQCYEAEREIPYAAIGTLIKGLIEQPGSSGTPPEWLAELATTTPAVSQRFTNLPSGKESAGEAARLRLAEAVHQLSLSVSEEHPLILLVDDVHLADDASVAILHLLMRRAQESRIMVVLSARPQELDQSPNASRLLAGTVALKLLVVDIPTLNETEVDSLISALEVSFSVAVPSAVHRSLVRASAGIPMILELMFDDWKDRGEQCLALSVSAMREAPGDAVANHFADQVYERVIKGLSDTGKVVLSMAALLGERLDDLEMYQLVDLSLAETLRGITELVERRILRDGGKGLEFRNELLRNKGYYTLPSSVRKSYHGLIADRLVAAAATGETVPGLMLAWHCFRAGRTDKAGEYLVLGAREASRRGAFFEVELAIESALKALTGENLVEAQILLADAYQGQGQWGRSLELLSKTENHTANQREQIEVLRMQAQSWFVSSEIDAREQLSRIRHRFMSSSAPVQAGLLSIAMRLVIYLGDANEARTELETCRKLLPRLHSLADRVSAHTACTTLCWLVSDETWGEELESLHLLSQECQAEGLCDSNVGRLERVRGCSLMALGRYSEAIECIEHDRQIAKLHGDVVREADAADNLSLCHGRLGNYMEQAAWAERALKTYLPTANWWWRARAQLKLAFSLCMRGENTKARVSVDSIPEMPLDVPTWVRQAYMLLSADILSLCGEDARAYEIAHKTLAEDGYVVHTRAYCGPLARWASKLFIRTSDAKAKQLVEALGQHLGGHDTIDQAEILSAQISIMSKEGLDLGETKRLLGERLSLLPPAVATQVVRLQVAS